MATQGQDKLVVVDGMPAVTKLWNGRFRLEFFCSPSNKNEGWYGDNIAKWLPEFGTLQGADFTGEGWETLDGEEYPNMCLVETEVPYIPPSESHLVKLVYETLTASWVEEKDEDIDYELNGLKRVTRTFVALPETAYAKVVGTDTIDSDGTTLSLGSFSIKKTDAKWELTETWLEAGELSRSDNFEDGKESVTITQIGGCASAPAGYTVVSEKKDNTQGFETCTRTFYKDDSELSRSNDYVGSQLAEMIEVFNPTIEPTPTNVTAVLGSKSQSNVDGIPTTRYTFLVPAILRLSQELVGGATRVQVSAFDKTEPQVDAALSEVTENHILISQREEDYEGIKTSEFVYEISDFSVRNQTASGLRVIQQTELSINNLTDGVIGATNISDSGSVLYLSSEEIDNGNTIKKRVRKFAEAGKISESEPIAGADGLKTKTIVWQMIEGDAPSGFINAARKVDNIGGAKTITTTYYDNADLISSQVYQSTEPFSLPGVVSWRRLNNGAFSDLILTVKPPISTTAVATVTVTYSTSGGISTPSNFYNPTEHTSVAIY